MSKPKTRIYFGGANADTPYVSVAIPDMRGHNYGPTSIVDIPRDENGDCPTHFTATIECDNSTDSFVTENPAIYCGRYDTAGNPLYCYGLTAADGVRVTIMPAINSMGLMTLSGRVYPGLDFLRFVNALANDPGVAVPGTMKVWFWKE